MYIKCIEIIQFDYYKVYFTYKNKYIFLICFLNQAFTEI